MSTLIPAVCDTHFMDKKPRSRKDDFVATQRTKINQVFQLSQSLRWKEETQTAAAIVFPGDLWHQPNGRLINRKLDHHLMQIFRSCPIPKLAIAGNHDMERDRIQSLESHPFGAFRAAGLFVQTHWPEYVVVGTDPPVIVTGWPYTSEGPARWLQAIRGSQQLIQLKNQVSEQTGHPHVQALVMTHNHWGPNDAFMRGEPVTSHAHVRDTGADIVVYGHPHTFDGTSEVEDQHGTVLVAGPGSMVRGTIAEHDISRQPRIALCAFEPDGEKTVLMVPIPHAPAEDVFHLERHEHEKAAKMAAERFVQKLQETQLQSADPEEIFSRVEGSTPANIVSTARQYMAMAESELMGVENASTELEEVESET